MAYTKHIFCFSRCYGRGQALRAWQHSTLSFPFEAKKENHTKIRIKTHTGSLADSVDKEAVHADVQSYPDDREVNWSELARTHNVTTTNGKVPANGGQIVKEWLRSEGVNVDRFKRKHDDRNEGEAEHSRRTKRRVQVVK